MEEPVHATSSDEQARDARDMHALNEADVAVGEPLAEPLVDANGSLLLAAGATLPDEAARAFLFAHFSPHRGSGAATPAADAASAQSGADTASASDAAAQALRIEDLDLTIGARLGMRPRVGMGRAMHPGRLIGMAPNRSLFAMLPIVGRETLPLSPGEQVELVVVSGQSVVWFVCTVDAVCKTPFDFVVFSAPGVIRQLRTRKQIRVRSHLAVRYGVDLTGSHFEGLGLGHDLSAQGMSLAASGVLGRPGERLCVSFRLHTNSTDTEVQAVASIRNVNPDPANAELTLHGLEFDPLDAAQQQALKAYVHDLQHDALNAGAA